MDTGAAGAAGPLMLAGWLSLVFSVAVLHGLGLARQSSQAARGQRRPRAGPVCGANGDSRSLSATQAPPGAPARRPARLGSLLVMDVHSAVSEAQAGELDHAGNQRMSQAPNRTATCEQARPGHPRGILLAIAGPDDPALCLVRQLHAARPRSPVLALLDAAEPRTIQAARRAGAAEYVLRTDSLQHLLRLLDHPAAEEPRDALPPTGRERAQREQGAPASPEPGPAAGAITSLTARERAVADLVATGQTNRQIAGRLGLSPLTVRNYVSAVLAKLGVPRRAAVAAIMSVNRSRN